MKPFHILVATLSLGGTLAAVSATHAAGLDPVPVAGSMGRPGAALRVPCDVLLAVSPRPCTKTLVQALRGGVGSAAVEALSDEALDLGAAEARPTDVYFIQAGDVILPIYIEHPVRLARGNEVARSAAVEAMLDLDAAGSDR